MRFQNFAPVAFLLLLPFATSDDAIDSQLMGVADVLFCIDITYEKLAKDNEGFQRIREFIGKNEGIQHQLKIAEGKHRLAVVKMDQKGHQVLMNLNEPASKLQTISETHFKDELDQKTPRTAKLKDIFANIKKEVFTPEKGDRPAPNILICLHLTDRDKIEKEESYKPYIEAGFDIVAGLITYQKVERVGKRGDTAYFRTFRPDNKMKDDLDIRLGVKDDYWILHNWIRRMTDCTGKLAHNFTDCYYVKDPASSPADSCSRVKLIKPSENAKDSDYCWNGEWENVTDSCKKEECDKTCEPLPYDAGGQCNAECNKEGTITKKYKGDKKEGKFCTKSEKCTGVCPTTGVKPDPKKSTPKKPLGSGETTAESESTAANPAPDTGLPIWAWVAIGGGVAAVVITVVIILVSCVLLKKKRKSSTKGKGKSKAEDSVRRGGNVSDRSDVAPRGRDQGQSKKGPKEASEISQRGSTKRDMSMTGRSTSRFTSRRR